MNIHITVSRHRSPLVVVEGITGKGRPYSKKLKMGGKKFKRFLNWIHGRRHKFQIDEIYGGEGWIVIALEGDL